MSTSKTIDAQFRGYNVDKPGTNTKKFVLLAHFEINVVLPVLMRYSWLLNKVETALPLNFHKFI